jgi:chemotaxis protein MotB
VRYLVEEGGVDRRMLEADGYADTRPVVQNDTEAGKAANRRIEIVLYPKELTDIARQGP